jgi:PAS domain S-box-containing protein
VDELFPGQSLETEPDPYLRVLLIEEEPNTISVVSLFLSEIKECKLTISPSGRDASAQIPAYRPDLVLFAHGLKGEDSLQIFTEIHKAYPALYLLVSLPEDQKELSGEYSNAGAVECILKDKSYILNLVFAVKSAMIRVAEKESLVLPPMPRAEQLSMDENLPDVVFVLDADGKFLHANRVVTEVLGYDANELMQRPITDLMNGQDGQEFESFLTRNDPGKHFQGILSMRSKNGGPEFFDLNCTEIEDFLIYGVARPQKPAKSSPKSGALKAKSDAAAELSDDSLPPMIGPYRIVTLLGAGSTGRVYKGYDEHLDRFVAIKVISKVLHTDNDHLERFHREAKILASITHPNIALVYYFGNIHGLPYFCMEYLPGGSLENLLQKKEKLDPEEAVSYTMQVALGLHEALKKGVVHLDIKPSNLMIAEHDRLKIVDFGFARKMREKESDADSSGAGSAGKAQAIPADYRVDIYSLGVTFFRMLYGTTPHSPVARAVELMQQDKLDPTLSKQLHEIVERMISREPDKQFKEYPQLIEELERIRRFFVREEPKIAPARAPDTPILMRGLVFDTPFPEILGGILAERLTGKLTMSWIDICKNIFFRDGNILGVLSNQEGESFLELLVQQNQLSGKKAKKLESGSFDLLRSYSWALREIAPDVRDRVLSEMKQLAMRTLQGMFSQVVGEYIFDQTRFRGELTLQIPGEEVLVKGVKEWTDKTLIRRRLFEKKALIQRNPEFKKLISASRLQASDTFLLFRFEEAIHFQDLVVISGIPEEECQTLVYLYKCLRFVEVTKQEKPSVSPPKAKAPSAREPVRETVRPKAAPPEAPKTATQRGPAEKRTNVPIQAEKPLRKEEAPPAKVEAAPLKAVRSNSEPEYFQYYQRCASESFNNKNYWASVEYCKKALEFGKNAEIFALMGKAFATHPKFRTEAMEAYKKALQLEPQNPEILRDMGDLYFTTASYKLARSKYQDALKYSPDDKHSKKRLAEISRKI